uniref:SHSP domain-containing protein n=1 Tax=Leersia perrieri TaxID=77586 RepID=A0A0D9VPR2_9ORYZ
MAAAAAAPRTYSDFVPPHKLVEEAEKKVLVLQIDLSTEGKHDTFLSPGFKKEQLRVQIDNHGKLRISGERQVAGDRWSRFHKDFQVPDDCNAGDVRARFDSKDRVLYITMPKLSPANAPPPPPAAAAPEKPNAAAAAAPPAAHVAAAKAEEKEQQEENGSDGDGGRQEAAPAAVVTGRRRKTPWSVILAVVLALVAAAGFYAKYRVGLMDPSAAPATASGGGHFSGLSDH